MNKKGQGISMTYIIIAALALVVLVVIVLFFTGGISKLTGGQKGLVEGAVPQWQMKLWTDRCKQACDLENKEDFCETVFIADINDDGIDDTFYMCGDFYGKLSDTEKEKVKDLTQETLDIRCPTITC